MRVRIPSGQPYEAVLVPQRSVGSDQGQKHVVLVQQDNTAEIRPVELGTLSGGMQVIKSGVKAGDTVVVDGLLKRSPRAESGTRSRSADAGSRARQQPPQNNPVNISQFFIDRPISSRRSFPIVITIVGGLALMTLPVAQYPEIVPPTVQVSASYSGANARTVAETVGAPIEQQVNGVENMLYMSSQSASDGSLWVDGHFQARHKPGYRAGVGAESSESRPSGASGGSASHGRFGQQTVGLDDHGRQPDLAGRFTRRALSQQLRPPSNQGHALRASMAWAASRSSAPNIHMRIWLDPNKLAALDLTAGDVVQAIQEQNKQVAAGVVGQQPAPKGTQFQVVVNAQGRLVDPAEFSRIVVKRGAEG